MPIAFWQSTTYWDIWLDTTFTDVTYVTPLKPFLDNMVTQIQADFGYDIFPLPASQPRLELVMDPASHGGATGTFNGKVGVTIAGDSAVNVAFSIQSFWFYILALHETVNVWTGTLATSWVWADGSSLWSGNSPFPNACDIIITAELGLNNVSAAQAGRFPNDYGVLLFRSLQTVWGWSVYRTMFSIVQSYNITDWSVYAEPLRTAIIVWFLSYATNKMHLLSQFNLATNSYSGQTVPDSTYTTAQQMFPAPLGNTRFQLIVDSKWLL